MRLDVFLVEKGYFASRSKAQSAISNGLVSVNKKTEKKPSLDVDNNCIIEIAETERFVSRAGYKLEKALNEFEISTADLVVLDIGASTGGFTDCLLQRGAKRVYALDVGINQLAEKLRRDNRVVVMEQINARGLKKSNFDEEIDMIVMDVSFISQSLIYDACGDILASGKRMITLVKPQFEAGRENIGKGGIVKDKDGRIIQNILEKLDFHAGNAGFRREKFCNSPIMGGDGNREYLALFVKE